ncbi:MAG: flagellar basal body L-ring protein FlgH [Sulfurimonas sp.]|nr:flagellar basal body L-ring protein FlgH [Sulfurimonas sp.]
MIKTALISLTLFYTMVFFSGCTAGLTEPEIDFEPPVYVEQMPSKEEKRDFVSTGSIFGQGKHGLFSDHKAMSINDIVQVVISETAQSTNSSSKQLSKDDKTDLNLGLFGGGDSSNGIVSSAVNKLNGVSNISFDASTTNAFKGNGSATKDASFTTTVTARIVKVLSNGNYFISGRREILIDEQKQIVQISGVIRPYDIDQYNKIDSAQMSEAKILYKTQGDVDRATQQGWGTKIVQSVWPF